MSEMRELFSNESALHLWTVKFDVIAFTSVYIYIFIYIYIYMSKVKFATVVQGNPKASFSIDVILSCREGCYSFSWITPFYL